MIQAVLDFSAPRPKAEPLEVPGGHLRDQIRAEAFAVLVRRGRGREAVITRDEIAAEVQARGVGTGLKHGTLARRIEEGLLEMLRREEPVCSRSAPPRGYWLAKTPEELEESLAESDQRARSALYRRRLTKRALARLRGQKDLEGTT